MHSKNKHNKKNTIMINDFIDIKALCELTGFKRGYIYKLVFEKRLPVYKPTGHKLFFKKSEIEELFNATKIKANYEE